ncbi:MAG: glycine--tRNA ligase subunit beta [Acidobacteriia bacterium]|nr:glycine--tRNA ligase subunit beta [Terriglobia bacterium]
MDKAELVVEIGTEEIPASMLESATHQLARHLIEDLRTERLGADLDTVWYTPRRMIVGVRDIPRRQEDLIETILGPPRRVAYDAEGKPTRAALAFAEKSAIPLSKIKIVETPKGEYLSAVRRQKGEQAARVLARLIPAAIAKIEFPKAMYWTPDKFRFARPLRWIVALYAGKVVRFALADVESSRYTAGHRFTGKPRIAVRDLTSLRDSLRENGVIVDPAERRATIQTGLDQAAEAAGGRLLADDSLLETVVNLNENPSVVCGAFDRRFLNLPEEILVTVMKEHQKYFSIVNSEGRLLPVFLAVINLSADPGAKIRGGHERVLRARFADAEFFWNSDRKTKLADREASLKSVLFQQKLGSYYAKTQRVLALLPKTAAAAACAGELPDLETAAHLLKCDLVTEMVKEFTDLQGIVGGLYARAEGYPEKVWRPVYEHYMPKASTSPSPSSLGGAVLALTDRLDTVCGCFSVGLIPTGSKDPFAVRRQGNGILKILLDHRIRTSLEQLITWSLEALAAPSSETAAELKKFFEGRLRFLFEEMGYSYDCINAALAVGFDDPADAAERARALQAMRTEQDFLALASSFKRVMNILAQSGSSAEEPDAALMTDAAETTLWQRYLETRPEVEAAGRDGRYGDALRRMASLRGVVDAFFEQVLVMAEDPGLRRNRLALLGRLAQLFLRVADISQIVFERAG